MSINNPTQIRSTKRIFLNWFRILPVYCLIAVALICAFAGWSLATTITFEVQGLGAPNDFPAAGPAQTLTISDVKFTGGVILFNASNLPADTSAVYGTADFGDPSLQNLLTITFPSNIVSFSMDVFNGSLSSVTYELDDNAGHAPIFSTLADSLSSGKTTIGFNPTGTVVSLKATTGLPDFDFFIDNVNFELSPQNDGSAVPEPTSLLLLGTGLVAFILSIRTRKK